MLTRLLNKFGYYHKSSYVDPHIEVLVSNVITKKEGHHYGTNKVLQVHIPHARCSIIIDKGVVSDNTYRVASGKLADFILNELKKES